MEDEFPHSASEAENHIRQIRRDKGLGDSPQQIGNNASDLEAALGVLSHDLYQTATHFLLELIQNADDNTYLSEEPTLSITYSPGKVRIDCNERGFAKKHVEAITRICKSTKSGRSKTAGFVGEKGIGFKAVFKVASTVWITSGHYSFKFDRDAHLGMIAPIWENFPEKRRKGCTSILMLLAKDCDENAVVDELRSYDPRILIFLRRLRRLEINVDLGFLKRGNLKRVLRREDLPSTNPSRMVLHKDKEEKNYLVWRHTADKLPQESRRPGISSSEIVLAFPLLRKEEQPVLENQSVYAFLPVRDYGFQFLLQGDFLLPANREDVSGDSAWNKTLTAAAAIAFVDAVQYMSNLPTNLRYTWIRYIPTQRSQSIMFEQFRQDVLVKLQTASILESQVGRNALPITLIKVPESFCDYNGKPFTQIAGNEEKFLSPQYAETDSIRLAALGVRTMTQQMFFTDIGAILKKNPKSFYEKKSNEWHASFSRTLISLNGSGLVRTLPVIPLRNNEWVPPSNAPIFFQRSALKAAAIPEGIEIKVVDPKAADDPDRRKFFALMGVREFADQDIATAIVNAHLDPKFLPNQFKPAVLVSHAKFLFTASLKNQAVYDLWMAAEKGSCRKSRVMYIPSDVPGAASTILPSDAGRTYGFLHPLYLSADGLRKKEWLSWLQSHTRVALYPHLKKLDYTRYYTGSGADLIHEDFKLIMKGSLRLECLTLLRDAWHFYKAYLDSNMLQGVEIKHTSNRVPLVSYMKGLQVKCTGDSPSVPISQSFMPLPQLVKEAIGLLPFMEIPDPEDSRWRELLECLGVGVNNDLRFYLQCLRGAKRNEKITWEQIYTLMQQVELKGAANLQVLRVAFSTEEILCIPPKKKNTKMSWISTKTCVWRGESWLTQSVGIERHYPNNEILFRNYLFVPNSGIDHIIKETELIRPGHTTAHIEKVFLTFCGHLKISKFTALQKERIKKLEIFPIVSSQKNEPYEYLTSVTSETPWLIADRAVFRVQFQDILSVLAFSVETILRIRRFLEALDLKDRFLSDVAISTTEAHGDVVFHQVLTDRYQARSEFLFRLIPDEQPDQKQLREKFRNIEVYSATKVIQYWRATLGISQVQSTLADGVAFLESDYAGDLRIYLRGGYESEANPCELADQLVLFFNVPVANKDLLSVVLAANVERIKDLFESRGIPPLVEEDEPTVDDPEEDDDDAENIRIHRYTPGGLNNGRGPYLQEVRESRFARLLRRARFDSSVPSHTPVFPSFGPAFARTTQTGVGQPPPFRASPIAFTLPSLKGTMTDLKFTQKDGALVGAAQSPPTILELFKALGQYDSDVGEMIVSDILEIVLGIQYDRELMWTNRRTRPPGRAAFTFTDIQGRFTSFLMRLDGMPVKAQRYGNLIYHVDVKATDKPRGRVFKMSQEELDRARQYSIRSGPDSTDSQNRTSGNHIAVLVHISTVRKQPTIVFLADPWDLFHDGQLSLENSSRYQVSLNLRPQQGTTDTSGLSGGFDTVQIGTHSTPIVYTERNDDKLATDSEKTKNTETGKEVEKGKDVEKKVEGKV